SGTCRLHRHSVETILWLLFAGQWAQALTFALGVNMIRSNTFAAILFAGAFLSRTAIDWFIPTIDFHTRSLISTVIAASILLVFGFIASWKSGVAVSGGLSGVATTAMAAVLSLIGASILFALAHDAATLRAIEGSGGLEEVFWLPVMLIVPGAILGI